MDTEINQPAQVSGLDFLTVKGYLPDTASFLETHRRNRQNTN